MKLRRACDCCISRKVKCDGGDPCRRCMVARSPLPCTYLKPAQKRGPKTSGDSIHQPRSKVPRELRRRDASQPAEQTPHRAKAPKTANNLDSQAESFTIRTHDDGNEPRNVPARILVTVIEIYRSRMYPVWPVLDVDKFIKQLQSPEQTLDTYVLAISLCGATMTQLNLSPMEDEGRVISSQDMEKECTRVRATCNYREQPNINHVLTSFFLHVYHAKADNQNTALLYIQEAITLARLLRLDDEDRRHDPDVSAAASDVCVLYLLLWVSERGYAIQYGLPISLHNTVSLSSVEDDGNVYAQGLKRLAELFATFDSSSVPRFSRYKKFPISASELAKVENALPDTPQALTHSDTIQKADFIVTKQWMRILLWQQAMSRGMLSSASSDKSMTFTFPAQVSKNLLRWMILFSTEDLIPLGRDQLVKLFEIANTLADVILCNPQLSNRGQAKLGPADFLHGLYQTISPLLELDHSFNSMLREKTAEVLVRAPTRFWMLDSGTDSDGDETSETTVDDASEVNQQFDVDFNAEEEDSDYILPFESGSMANLAESSVGSLVLW